MENYVRDDVMRLGFGLMRLHLKENGDIDEDLARKLIDTYMARGGRYFDTAHTYLDGRSEGVIRRHLVGRYPREDYYVATKLPLFSSPTKEGCRQMMELSLERLGTGYVDFWLIHSLREETLTLAEECGAWDLMKEYKAAGKAKHIGFSYHDSPELLGPYLDRHPEAEFVQLQINYFDWEDDSVRARECYEVARAHGLPVIVMEPVKGGSLALGNTEVLDLLGGKPAATALRWVSELPGVMMILSGMNEMNQVEENTAVLSSPAPLSDYEHANVQKAVEILRAVPRIGCTDCRYCMEGCPMSIRIPWIIRMLNNWRVYQNAAPVRREFRQWRKNSGKPSECVGCGQCEGVCPQHLPIPELMGQAAELLE